MPIIYNIEDIEVALPSEERLSSWLYDVAASHKKSISEISYIFCSDEYLLGINKKFLNHDYYTDIITFPYKQGDNIESDIFISIDRVRENAKSYDSDFQKELLRVMAHGVLHLIGFGDKTEEDAQVMRDMENKAIALWKDVK